MVAFPREETIFAAVDVEGEAVDVAMEAEDVAGEDGGETFFPAPAAPKASSVVGEAFDATGRGGNAAS